MKITEIRVRQFLATELSKAKGKSKEKLADVISRIDFSTIRLEPFKHEFFSDIKEVILMDLPGINVDDFLNLSKTETIEVRGSSTDTLKGHASITKVVFFQTASQIKEGNILHLSSPISSKEELDRDIVSIIMAKKKGFTGRYCTNFLTKRLQNDFRWNNGKVVSSTVLRPKGGKVINNNVAVSAQVCYDWYKTTTYYYTDGSYFIDEVYLGRTCSGSAEPGENQEFQTDLNGGALLEQVPDTLDCSKLKGFGADTTIKSFVAQLKDSASNSSNEAAYSFEIQTNGNFIMKQKLPTNNHYVDLLSITSTYSIDAVIHSHPGGLATFSLVDIAGLFHLFDTNKIKSWATFMLGVVINDGTIYILRITDNAKFATFGNSHLRPLNFDSWVNANIYSSTDNVSYQISKLTRAIENSGLELFKTEINSFENGLRRLDAVPEGVQYFSAWPCN